jgi:hypothetical protein
MPDPIRPPTSGVDPVTDQVTPPPPGPGAPEEPVLSTASIVTVVTAVLALLVALGLPVNDDVQAAVLSAIAVIAPIVLGLLARSKVFSPFTAGAMARAEAAKATREAQTPPPANPAPGEWLGL